MNINMHVCMYLSKHLVEINNIIMKPRSLAFVSRFGLLSNKLVLQL